MLKVIFSYDYLWINVRVKGGAYGCMSGSYRNGDMYMVSYRDPNLRKTNDIYENAADYLEHFDVSDRDMVKFIIGTIGDMDTPMNRQQREQDHLVHTSVTQIMNHSRKKEVRFLTVM